MLQLARAIMHLTRAVPYPPWAFTLYSWAMLHLARAIMHLTRAVLYPTWAFTLFTWALLHLARAIPHNSLFFNALLSLLHDIQVTMFPKLFLQKILVSRPLICIIEIGNAYKYSFLKNVHIIK